MTAFFICRSISHTLNDSPLQPNLNVKCRRGCSGGGAYLTLLSELHMRIVGNKVDKILQNHHLISFYGCKFPGIINPVRQEAGFLTTDFEVLWTAKILTPMENLMHFTSPLSSILWKQYSFKHDRDTLKLWMSYLVRWYLKATLLLSSGPFTMTPVAPPERTANTYRQYISTHIQWKSKISRRNTQVKNTFLFTFH